MFPSLILFQIMIHLSVRDQYSQTVLTECSSNMQSDCIVVQHYRTSIAMFNLIIIGLL